MRQSTSQQRHAEYIAGVNPGATTFRQAHGDSLLLRLSVMTVEAAGPISEAITEGIRIEVMSRYAPENARPGDDNWLFEYTVRITNEGTEAVQLLSRHWYITDALDHTREVEGAGVVGKQPTLAPGESFKYSSWCPLKTPTGTMRGTYTMVRSTGERFDAEIAPFVLRARYMVH